MERLTARSQKNNLAYLTKVNSEEQSVESEFPNTLKAILESIQRLAEYEDTNLTPSDIADLRNELCLKCGKYKTAHEGACNGCRWRDKT